MHCLTKQQKIENYQELIQSYRDKIENLERNISALEQKIENLKKINDTEQTQKQSTGLSGFLQAAEGSR